MARDVQTKAVLKAEVKGFVEAAQAATKINKAASIAAKDQLRNTKEVEKELGRMGSRLKELARLQVSLNQEMGKIDKASGEYKKLSERMKEVNKQQDEMQRASRNVERAFKDQGKAVTAAQMARGGFAQGLIQGATPGMGPFLQRGPGMARQAVGMGVGRGLRGMANVGAGMPFGGMQALVQGLQSVPIAGALAAPIAKAMQQAQQAISYHQVRMGAMPFLGGLGLRQRMDTAGQAAGAGAAGSARGGGLARLGSPEAEQEIRIRAHKLVQAYSQRNITEEDVARERGGSLFGGVNPALNRRLAEMRKEGAARQDPELIRRANQIERVQVEQNIRNEAEQAAKNAASQARGKARAGVRNQALGDIQSMGVRFGMALPQITQFAAGVSRAGGGVGVTSQERRMRETALSAQVGYGVQPGVAGAFLAGGRRGGLVGGGGRATESMVEAMQEATKLGLEGSELNDYLQQIADGITSWKSTGIPFNKASMAELSTSLGATIGGVRGMRIAGAVRQMGIQMGGKGPQNLGELMMFRSLTGLARGASQEEIWQAQIRSQEQEFEPGGLRKGIRGLIAGGSGGVRGLRAAYPEAAKFGISKRELTMMHGLETEGLTPEIAKWMTQTPAGLARAVEYMGGGEEGRRAVRGRLGEAGIRITEEDMLTKLGEAPIVGAGAKALETPEALAKAAMGAVPETLKEMARLTNLQIRTGETIALDLGKIDTSIQQVTKDMITFLKPVFEFFGVEFKSMANALGTGPDGVEMGPK